MGAGDAKLVQQTVRLFADDVKALKKAAAEKRSKWQTELRHLVHRALQDQKRVGELIR